MISIVVPIYNEEDLIVQFHEAVPDPCRAHRGLGSCVCQRWLH